MDQDADDEVQLSEEQRDYIKKMLKKLMKLGFGAIYGIEDDGEDEVVFECQERLPMCRAICCSFNFAITKEEVQEGHIKWDSEQPYFIKREEDGYCSHFNRETCICSIWDERPRRGRQYDCRNDPNVWLDWDNRIINPNVFDHLAKKLS